jgi:hypothetical protein
MSNDSVSRKEVPFGVPTFPKNFQGVHFPPRIRISTINKTMNNFSTVHAIFAQISSIGAAWRKKFKNSNQITTELFMGSLFGEKNASNGDFKPKHPVE